MSNYIAPAFHPKTGKIVDANWIDDYFGPHVYGVRFDGDDKTYKSIECAMEAASVEIDRLRSVIIEWRQSELELGNACSDKQVSMAASRQECAEFELRDLADTLMSR